MVIGGSVAAGWRVVVVEWGTRCTGLTGASKRSAGPGSLRRCREDVDSPTPPLPTEWAILEALRLAIGGTMLDHVHAAAQLHSVVEHLVMESGRSALLVLSAVSSVVNQDLGDCVDPDECARLMRVRVLVRSEIRRVVEGAYGSRTPRPGDRGGVERRGLIG